MFLHALTLAVLYLQLSNNVNYNLVSASVAKRGQYEIKKTENRFI